MDLNEIAAFVAVGRAGGFAAAARRLQVPPSTVSRRVAALERRLGTRLLYRTTRRLRLTEAGARLLEQSAPAVAQLSDAERLVGDATMPRGNVTFSAPVEYGVRVLGPIVAEFCRTYPDVTVRARLTARVLSLIEDGIDVAIRTGPLADSSLTARRIGAARFGCYASRDYLMAHGTPATPAGLDNHRCLLSTSDARAGGWSFTRDGQTLDIALAGPIEADNLTFLMESAVAGLGIARLPSLVVAEQVAAGHLIEVLEKYSQATTPLYAVLPTSKLLPPAVRAFVDLVAERLAEHEPA